MSSRWRKIPTKPREWLSLRDWLRVRWLASGRKPLKGRVRVSYLWENPEKQTPRDEAEIGLQFLKLMEFMIHGTPYLGQARCELEPNSKLVLTIEGD